MTKDKNMTKMDKKENLAEARFSFEIICYAVGLFGGHLVISQLPDNYVFLFNTNWDIEQRQFHNNIYKSVGADEVD